MEYPLYYTTTLLDYMMAVGGSYDVGDNKQTHNKTELYSTSNVWSTESDYPYGAEYSYLSNPIQ